MSDDKTKKDGRDRSKVAGDEGYEITYLAKQLGVSETQVRVAVNAVGNNREKVIEYIKKHK